MKQSEMLITMPLTTYNELLFYKNEFERLSKEISDCFTPTDNNLQLNLKQLLDIAKNKLPIKYKNFDIDIQKH